MKQTTITPLLASVVAGERVGINPITRTIRRARLRKKFNKSAQTHWRGVLLILVFWSDLGTVTASGDYPLPRYGIVTVTEANIQTAHEILQESGDPLVSFIETSGSDKKPCRFRIAQIA